MSHAGEIEKLLQIMRRLRDPDGGCPWDLEQDFRSIASYTVEEAYEVADAIERDEMGELADELGDLLFQVVFHSQLAAERGAFEFADVVRAINDKMLRRHPHVFGDAQVDSAEAQTVAWERHKQVEREQRHARSAARDTPRSALDDVPRGLPEAQRALKLQKRGAQQGFDWPTVDGALAKLSEEIAELRAEIAAGASAERMGDELGDVAFVLVNVGRHLQLDFGAALRRTNGKFERRFRRMEELARAAGAELADTPFAEQDQLWELAKAEDHRGLLDSDGSLRTA